MAKWIYEINYDNFVLKLMIESVLVYFLKYIFYKIFKALETVQIQIINMNYTKTNKQLTFLYPSPSHDMFPATQLRNLILINFIGQYSFSPLSGYSLPSNWLEMLSKCFSIPDEY